jgi:hypothetical protein
VTAIVILGCAACKEESEMRVVQFRESDSLISNPGQGWMTMRRTPEPGMRFPYTVVYRSFNWADAEPEQGKIDWALIDDVIKAWKPWGATVSFRVMPTNPHSKGYYASPKWLFDAGCKGFEYIRGGGTFGGAPIKRIEPDYSDPLYLKYHGAFIEALGRRYDGDPNIEFIDIGSYGYWGEWHTSNWAPIEVRRQIVDFYLKAFKKTQLVFMSDGAELLQYGLDHGTGMRRDGVGSTWHEQNWIGSDRYAAVPGMVDAWKHNPIVFEWYGRYDHLISQGWSFPAAINFMQRNHVTIVNDNVGDVPPDAFGRLEELAKRAGARLVLRELTYPASVRAGDRLPLKMRVANVGVGKLYYPYVLRLSLVNAAGEAVCTTDAKALPTEWLPGEYEVAETLATPSGLPAGQYTISAALEDPAGQRRSFRFAIDVPEKNGRHLLSKVQIENEGERKLTGLQKGSN